jgi:hypothetical protein
VLRAVLIDRVREDRAVDPLEPLVAASSPLYAKGGAPLPIPITCTVRFGAPMSPREGESKEDFLARARSEVIELAGRGAA